MKKLLSKTPPRLLLLLLAFFCSHILYAFEVDGIAYNILSSTNKTVEVTSKSSGYAGSVSIPSTVSYNGISYSVTTIGSEAFRDCSSLTSVTIPTSVTHIKSYAFSYCSSLTSVTIPNSVTTINSYAFRDCSKLIFVFIPQSVTYIDRYVFEGKNNIKSFVIESELITDYKFLWYLSDGCTVYASDSQFSKIRECFSNVCSYRPCLKDVKSRFTECELELYVPDGCEITGTEMLGNGSLTKIADTDNCYKATNLLPGTSYRALFNFTYPSGSSETIETFDTQTVDDALEVSVTSDITSITLTLTKGSDEVSEQGVVFDSNYYPLREGESKTFTGLLPNRTYLLRKYVKIDGEAYKSEANYASTLNINIDEVVKTSVYADQASFTVCLIEGPAEGWECGVGFNGERYPMRPGGESKKFTGLVPFTSYYYTLWVKIDDTYYDFSKQIGTKKVVPIFTVTAVSPISVKLNGYWTIGDNISIPAGDAVVTGCQAIVDGRVTEITPSRTLRTVNAEIPINYNSNRKHTIVFKVIGDGWEFTSDSKSIDTPYLQWLNGEAVATSTHSARLMYEVNLPTGTPGTGIEWRRIDAPDLVSSTKVPCDVVNGTLIGTLKNLKDDVYYKFRPYYTALDGKSYYGTWVGLFTGDADVFFEPEVLTYAPTSSEQSVTLSGYALEGSDEIISQGFEYRPSTPVVRATSGWSVVKADGILMKATLTDLIPNAIYICRSFVTTGSGTYYGEEQQFTAPALTCIDAVEEDMNDELSMTLRENPVNGDAYIRISGPDNKAICSVYSLSGTLLIQKEVAADGLWQPVEMDRCVKGMYLMHVVCGNERKSLRVIKR